MKIFYKIYLVIRFIFYYLYKLLMANLFIAYDILTPKMLINPGFMTMELNLKSDFGLLMFTNLVSMTPGTLSMDLDEKRKNLLVHVLYMDRCEETKKELSEIMEKIKRITE